MSKFAWLTSKWVDYYKMVQYYHKICWLHQFLDKSTNFFIFLFVFEYNQPYLIKFDVWKGCFNLNGQTRWSDSSESDANLIKQLTLIWLNSIKNPGQSNRQCNNRKKEFNQLLELIFWGVGLCFPAVHFVAVFNFLFRGYLN